MSSPDASSVHAAATPGRRSAWRTALACAAGVGLVAALLGLRGAAQVGAALRSASWPWVGLAGAAYGAFFAVRGLRWRLVLGPGGAGWGAAAAMTAAGWTVSTVVPMKAGDVLRAAWMGRRHRAGVAAVGGSVALERLLDVGGLAIVALLAAIALAADGTAVPAGFRWAVAVAWLLPGLGLAALVALAAMLPAARRRHAVLRMAGRALDQAHALLLKPRLWAPAGVLTLAATGLQAAVYVCLVRAFLPQADGLLLLAGAPLFLLSFAVAVTPGHLGTYEAAFVLVFAPLGIDASRLAAVAVAVHLLTASLVAVLGGASFAALTLTRSPADQPLHAARRSEEDIAA